MKRAFTIITFLLLTIQSFGQDYKYVTTETLNVRQKAGKQYSVVGQINKGDKVSVISQSDDWTEIESSNGIKGFVATKYLDSTYQTTEDKEAKSPWGSLIILLLILGFGIYKAKNFLSGIFGNTSSNASSTKKPATKIYSQPKQTDTFHLSIKDGVVNLGKEHSTMRRPVFNYFDKAVDCDLEDPKNDRSRFLVVTSKGDVVLCKLQSTGKDFVFKPFISFGSAYKARFADSNSFIFTTEKGTYKGYFNSTKKEKLA